MQAKHPKSDNFYQDPSGSFVLFKQVLIDIN